MATNTKMLSCRIPLDFYVELIKEASNNQMTMTDLVIMKLFSDKAKDKPEPEPVLNPISKKPLFPKNSKGIDWDKLNVYEYFMGSFGDERFNNPQNLIHRLWLDQWEYEKINNRNGKLFVFKLPNKREFGCFRINTGEFVSE
jgi:hypothetical protein